MIQNGNPSLKLEKFANARDMSAQYEPMTINGTIHRSAILVALAFMTALWSFNQTAATFGAADPTSTFNISPLTTGSFFATIAIFILLMFKNQWAPVLAPAYALAEGVLLGAISAGFEMRYPGIASQAMAGTFGTLLVMLFLYQKKIIRVTDKLRSVVLAAGLAIMLTYLVSFVMSFFGGGLSIIDSASPLGIGFSVVVCGVAAFFLLLDFDTIEKGAALGAPKYMEWYCAFGLLVTLVWLYLEILRLIAKLRSRD